MKKKIVFALLLFACLLSARSDLRSVIGAQETETENWLGTLDVKVAKLRIQIELTRAGNGDYSGHLISLDQGSVRIKIDRLVRTDTNLEFDVKKLGASYQGTLNKDQTLATGQFTQGRKFDLEFKRVEAVKADKHTQTWKGLLRAAGKEFDFQFRVFEDSEGKKLIKLDSFSEGLKGIGCDVEYDGDDITINVPSTAAKYKATLSEDRQTAEGHWIQGGGKFPLTLTQIPLEQTRTLNLKRPQTPKPPFDYVVSEFSVAVKTIDAKYDADVVLAGTMTLPNGDGPYPTVILISGSGPQDRDETIFDHKPFFVLADHLTKKGFAVIRYDERGVGESKGTYAGATSADFANDVEALFRWAQNQEKVDAKRIVLAGHSEGGLVAPMVASRQPEVAGVIMLAGPGVPGDQIILNQSRKIAAVSGLPEDVLEMQENFMRRLMAGLSSKQGVTDDLKKALEAEFGGLSEEQRSTFQLDDVVEQTISQLDSPWMKYFLEYDPATALEKTSCPILSLIGEKDLQVDAELNMPAIEAAVKAGGNPDFTQSVLPNLNHLFQACETGSPTEYITIEETLNQLLLDQVTDWLEQRFK